MGTGNHEPIVQAIRFNKAKLVPRLLSHFQSRAVLTALHNGLKDTGESHLSKLTLELIDEVGRWVQEAAYEEVVGSWTLFGECISACPTGRDGHIHKHLSIKDSGNLRSARERVGSALHDSMDVPIAELTTLFNMML